MSRAKQRLQEALALISQPKPFVIAVSDAARAYLEERFQFRATGTDDPRSFYASWAERICWRSEQKESLGGFLESCDLVKFAKYEPAESELRGLHESAV